MDYQFNLGRFGGVPVYESPYLPEEVPRRLNRKERWRVRLEDLCDRADIYWPWPRVQRTKKVAALMFHTEAGLKGLVVRPETIVRLTNVR